MIFDFTIPGPIIVIHDITEPGADSAQLNLEY